MKFKATKKEIMNGFRCYKVGYCDLSHLFYALEPIAYTCGVYGWNADIYDLGNDIAIVTGYRPFGESVNYEICRKYDRKAQKIINVSFKIPYERKRKALDMLIKKFMVEIAKKC